MPRYVYHCPECRREFEVEKGMQQSSQGENCPQCGRGAERVFTAPALGRSTSDAQGCENACGQGCCPGGNCRLD